MLARFDSEIQQRGALRRSDAPRHTLWLLTGMIAFMLIGWLVYRYLLQPAWIGRLPGIVTELFSLMEAASLITLGIPGRINHLAAAAAGESTAHTDN